jgi:hypothetical protein
MNREVSTSLPHRGIEKSTKVASLLQTADHGEFSVGVARSGVVLREGLRNQDRGV